MSDATFGFLVHLTLILNDIFMLQAMNMLCLQKARYLRRRLDQRVVIILLIVLILVEVMRVWIKIER